MRRALLVALLPLAAACTDRSVMLPNGGTANPAPQSLPKMTCTVDVPTQRMSCTDGRLPSAGRATILGSQDKYVRLASSGTSYDNGTEILSSNVTVQNLLRMTMGVDSTTSAVTGFVVFFQQEPTTTVGTGTVTIANADGLGTFTGTNQPYFSYNQSLDPYQISAARNWQFNVPVAVTQFTFSVYVDAPLAASGALRDHVWTGDSSTVWSYGPNWNVGAAPDSGSTVEIPASSLLPSGNMPVLDGNGALTNLDVGTGSTLGLGGYTLVVWGNLDALGTISNGTLWSRGTNALLGGSLSSVVVSGSAALQRPTVASGAVSVSDGSLNVKDQTLSIQIP